MSSTVTEERSVSAGRGPAELRALFFLPSLEYDHRFEPLLRAMLSGGHEVLVALDHHKEGLPPDRTELFDELGDEYPEFDYRQLPQRKDLWLIPATAIRRRLDYLRYLESDHSGADPLGGWSPRGLKLLLFLPPFRWSAGRRLIQWLLRRLEAGIPIPRRVRSFISDQRPDVVLVSPLVGFGSAQGDYVRAAERAGIPSVLVAPHAGRLSDDGVIRDAPTMAIVADDEQVEDAVGFHGVPRERIVAVGAETPGGDGAEAGDSEVPAPPIALSAVEEAAQSEVVARREGRFLRPLLWLLTPLMAILLPFLRPRATFHALVTWLRRAWKRTRRWARTVSRRLANRRIGRRVTRARAARAKEKERILAQKERERAAAMKKKQEAKAALRQKNLAAMSPERARAHAAKQAKRQARAARADGSGKGTIAPGARTPAASEAEPAATGESGRAKKPPIWRRKAVRGRVRAVRRRWKYTRRAVRRFYNRRYRFTYKRTIKRVPARDELPALLNARGLLGRGAEIGVKLGNYSDELLSNWRGAELVSIDPWLSADPDEYVDRSNVSQDEFDSYYEQTCERLGVHGSRSTIWRLTSVEAATKVPDHSFDFVYIDARHDYDSVLEDLDAWCAKVRPGGILAGHDYVDGDLPEGEFYVKSAVDEFFGAREIPVHATEGPSAVESFPTWIVEVPEDGIEPTRAEVHKAPAESGPQTAADEEESARVAANGGDRQAAREREGEESRA